MATALKTKIFFIGSKNLEDKISTQDFSITQCVNIDFAHHQIIKGAFDVAIIELSAIKTASDDTNKWIEELSAKCPNLPIIMCCYNASYEEEINAIKAGATEFISDENITLEYVSHLISRAIERVKTVQNRINPVPDNKPIIERRNKTRWQTPEIYAVGTSILDRLSMGVVLVAADGSVRLMNAKARNIIANQDGFFIDRSGICRASSSEETVELLNLIRKTTIGEVTDSNFALVLSRKYGKSALSVLVAPVGKGQIDDEGQGQLQAGAAIFISDPEDQLSISPAILRKLYGLSKTEATLVMELVKGKSFNEMAEEIGISHHTVRSHFKKIFAKTEVSRQAELVKLILTGPAAIRTDKQ
ncbi:MAG: helix-turn-helix transcriptional regulator [Alphaproteobacteria bacterium]|nr:helix-turn-helix transcriptional regulator [Alphaproteobacteria bacterium]